jgi:hypothetical protein
MPLGIGVYPGAPMVDELETVRAKVEESLAPGLVKALTGAAPEHADATPAPEPRPGEVVFSGSYDEVQEYFHDRLWTDGLPITPPTRERVEAFFRYTDRDPEEVLGVVPQESREASIRAIANAAVMSGCRPEYMPILIAAVQAMLDPTWRIQDCGSTPGWEPVVIVSGPIARELDFNSGQGMMRFGRRANTSVGRFIRMFLRNICGYRIPPGAGDKGSIGQSFLVAMSEDENAAQAIGWPTYAQDRGFASGENVVTMHSVVAITSPIYSGGEKPEIHVNQWADVMEGSFTYWAHAGLKGGLWNPLIVAGPSVAEAVARSWSKDKVRQHIWERLQVTAERMTYYGQITSTPTYSLKSYVEQGLLPPEYADSDDPRRLVHTIIKPEMIEILVAGDPGRNQSRAYMSNHIQGPPVSRKIEVPGNWPPKK